MTTATDDYAQYQEEYGGLLFTKPQTATLELIPYFTAPLSAVGSSLILRAIWSGRFNPMQNTVYHRLMLGISIFDLISSMAFIVFGPWIVPEFVDYTLYGRGTFTTCEVGGFFVNFLFGTMWYSTFLALYFLLLLRWEWREETMARTLEPVAHAFSLLLPLTTGIFGLTHDIFNPLRHLPGTCALANYPPYCATEDNTPDCSRGGKSAGVVQIVYTIALSIMLVVIGISMVSIVLKVRQTERKLRNYAVGGTGRMDLSRTHETAWQGVLYIGSFFAVSFPIILLTFLQDPDQNTTFLFVFALLTKIFSPMQGFFNAYIYLRKQFWRLTVEGQSFGFLCKVPLFGGWFAKVSDRHNNANSNNNNNAQRSMDASSTKNDEPTNGDTLPLDEMNASSHP